MTSANKGDDWATGITARGPDGEPLCVGLFTLIPIIAAIEAGLIPTEEADRNEGEALEAEA